MVDKRLEILAGAAETAADIAFDIICVDFGHAGCHTPRVLLQGAAVVDEIFVRHIMGKFETRIREVFERAWQDWMEMPKRAVFSARSRASLVFDLLKNHALAEFDGDPDIHIIVRGQTVMFLFQDCVLVRFKKANSAGLGSNIETQAVIAFVSPQVNIPGLLPDMVKVEVNYHLDKLATRIKSIAVTARDGGRKLWAYEARAGEGGAGAGEVIDLVPASKPGDDTPPYVFPRTPKNDSADNSSNDE